MAESVWDTLIARDPATGELTGNLAVAWRRIDDLTLEFDLRRGVRFHNGEEFDADDVVYTINYAFLQMNTLANTPEPPLREPRVRQAIAHAIDRQALVAHLVGEGAAVLHTVCHPKQFGCTDAGAPHYGFDPARARMLLREAGYPEGFEIDLYAYRDRNAVEAIMGYLADVGIRARLQYLQESAVDTARHQNRAGLMYVGYGPLSDIRSSLSFYHNFTPNDVNRDAEIGALVLRGDATMGPDARVAVYTRALALIAEHVYALPLYSLPNFYVATAGLDFTPPADETPRFYEMSYR